MYPSSMGFKHSIAPTVWVFFKIKENEYKASIAEIKAQIRTLGDGIPNFYQDACRTLELSKRLFLLFLESSYEERPVSSNSWLRTIPSLTQAT
jgi:hypothetical protein